MKKKAIISTFLSALSFGINITYANPQDTTAILLDEVTISAGVVSSKTSPLRIKQISQKEISILSPGRTFPELLRNTPSIFVTSESGSYGDAKINIRGFKQENISVLLNGIPISGLTSGSMFWNNWMGLSDATASINVQKGIGGSMLSDNSVGGTINIITKSPSTSSTMEVGALYNTYGVAKTHFSYNSGQLAKGWGVTLNGSYTWGEGYVQCTDVSTGSYMLSVSKKLNKKHSFLFTALGSPERHKQRSARLTYAEVEKYGRNYSKNWGYYNGEAKTISENNYFKPYFTFNHFYKETLANGIKVNVNNAAYLAIGNGGGAWTEATKYPNNIISHQKDGHIDWDKVVEENKGGASQNILSQYMAGHTQFGVKSNVIVEFNPIIKLETGIHYQLYQTWENEKITDLLGGDYWFENYEKNSLAGVAGRETHKKVGDYIRTNNGRDVNYLTLYGLSTATLGKWILKLGASASGSSHQRWDKYNYMNNIKSKIALGGGGSLKMGALYKINNANSLYLNAAAYSKAPYTKVYFPSGNNSISKDVKNEENFLGEIGYRLIGNKGGVEATFYSAYWKNKTLMSDPYKPLEEDSYKFMITGLDAFHYGGEIEAFYRFAKWLKMDAFASIGDWKWKNNVSANIYDPYSGQVAQTINVYSDGLPVGDAPQTQIGASIDFQPIRPLLIRLDWQYNDRYWADFDPATRKNPEDKALPYRIPGYHLLNLHASLSHRISKSIDLSIFFNVNNLTDSFYIERSKDGKDHSSTTFTGYWGAPRNFNFGFRVNMY